MRGDRPGHSGGLRLPAELARHADPAAHGSRGGDRHVRVVPAAGLLHQHDQHVRPGAGHRHRGGRRHRGGGGGAAQDRRGHDCPRTRPSGHVGSVSAPVVAIAFILAAVFIPVAFLGGISGQIYKQFALTIAASVLLSAFSALSLSPALAALLLRPAQESHGRGWRGSSPGSTARSSGPPTGTSAASMLLIRRSALALRGTLCCCLAARRGHLFKHLPDGFLPDEDQGAFFVSVRLPDGASTERTDAAAREDRESSSRTSRVSTRTYVWAAWTSPPAPSNSNVATVIATLKPWEERKAARPAARRDSGSGAARVRARFPKPSRSPSGCRRFSGSSTTGGFQFMLEDRAGGDIDSLARAADSVTAGGPPATGDRGRRSAPSGLTFPQYNVDMDTDKVQTMGIPLTDAYNTLQTFLGRPVRERLQRFGHTWQVLLQAEPEFREQPDRCGPLLRPHPTAATWCRSARWLP